MVMETSDVDGSNEQRKHVKLFQRSKTSLRRIMSRSSHTRVNSSDSLGSSVSSIRVRESSNSSSEDTQTTATTTTTAPRLVLRISVLRGRQLHAFEDTAPNSFAVVRCAGQQQRTHVVKKSSEPEYHCTFDVRLSGNRSRGTRRRLRLLLSRGLVISVCDRDRFKSVYLGQVRLPADELFGETDPIAYDRAEPKSFPITRTATSTHFNKMRRRKLELADELGELEIKYGLAVEQGTDPLSDEELRELWSVLFEQPKATTTTTGESQGDSSSSLPSDHNRQPGQRRKHRLRRLTKRKAPGQQQRKMRRRGRRQSNDVAQFYSDVFGAVYIEVMNARDLPPERNMTRTGFDMDPFVVISYGKTTFRTSSVRHNLNPDWNEKLMFHVRANETRYSIKFAVYDKDKFTKNDHVAWAEVPIMDIIKQPHAIDMTNQHTPVDAIEAVMEMHKVDLQMVNKEHWGNSHHPTLTFRAKFVPYSTIRKMFWTTLANASGISADGRIDRLEIVSLLESLGSTISDATLNSFWKDHGKDPETESLTIDEFITSIENFMSSTDKDHRRRSLTTAMEETQLGEADDEDNDDQEDEALFSGDDACSSDEEIYMMDEDEMDEDELLNSDEDYGNDVLDDSYPGSSSSGVSDDAADDVLLEARQFQPELKESLSDLTNKEEDNDAGLLPQSNEKVIRLAECPICHRPFVSKRAQMDIVTHVATCASHDWTAVDHFLMGNFVTEAYAQRRWFVKLVSKVGYGTYKPGSDNANIIVQDRMTGQLIEERMSVYVRLGMRIMYKGMKTGIQSKTAQRILSNMTYRQGRRYDSPQSVREIAPFIKFHNLDMSEVLDPIDSFKSFNEFFYRKLKPNARPCECPDDPTVAVSAADCRMMAFPTISDATRLWIKGVDFTVEKLLGDPDKAALFDGGSLAIFRLAPQDYHRFHSPVDGRITEITKIAGQYYTVNPMAIRTTLDVYGENARDVVMFESEQFGKVAVVCIGAMMVGSICLTADEGTYLHRADELGYFAFGGSTIVVLWQKDTLTFDQDLVDNSEKTIETLVRVGHRIGHRPQ